MSRRSRPSSLHTRSPAARLAAGLALVTLAACGSAPTQGNADMATPANPDLSAAPDQATPDLATPDMTSPPTIPRYSIGGPVNAVLHYANAWFIGGAFDRVSTYASQNLLRVDPSGTPTGCGAETGFNGGLSAIASAGNSVYVVGAFTTYRGAKANRIAKLDATTCALDTTFQPTDSAGFDGLPTALLIANNALYVGGQFSTYRGESANRVAKLDLLTGAIDRTFSPLAQNGFDGNVSALASAGTALYVGGAFNNYRGASASRLAKIDLTSGALDATFSPAAANGFNDAVQALTTSATSLYVGGYFTAYRGAANSALRLARLDLTSGALDTTFSPPGASANGVNDVIFALAVSGGSLYLGGRFTAYRGVAGAASMIAKLDAQSGALDTTFTGGGGFTGFQVVSLLPVGSSLYVGGNFNSYRGQSGSAYNLAKLDAATGAQDLTFRPASGNSNGVSGAVTDTTIVNGLSLQGGNIWLAGRFTVYGGWAANNLVKLNDKTFAIDLAFSPPAANGFNAPVNALAANGGAVYVGGSFTAYRGVANSANRLARVDPLLGILDTNLSPVGANGFDSTVRAIVPTADAVYVGGDFTAYRGASNSTLRVAKLTLAGALSGSFNVAGQGFDARVNALAVSGTALYAGGEFTTFRGASARRLAKLDQTSGALDATFSPAAGNGFDAPVLALATSDTALYAGGDFTSYTRGAVSPLGRVARLDVTSGALDAAFTSGAGFDGRVSALALYGAGLFAGGDFTSYRGAANAALRLARLDTQTGALDASLGAAGASGTGVDATVSAVGADGTVVVAGGAFGSYRGAATLTRGLLLLDPVTYKIVQ